jgi:uncharacterized protein (UPF0276 family)
MKPLVGLLYNPMVPAVLEQAPELVECLEVIPDRLWYDLGPVQSGRRFRHVQGAIEAVRRVSEGRVVAGHGVGLSLPSAIPLDREEVDHIAAVAVELDFQWYSEHLSVFHVPHSSVPNSLTGFGLPVVYDQETFGILRTKLATLRAATGCELLMENGAFFAPLREQPMSEPQFLNRLYAELGCSTLLDLHNLYASWRNGGPDPMEYLEQLNPACVREIHLGGGDLVEGFYTGSHSDVTPHSVWSYACAIAPTLRNLRAITFEFHESYFEKIQLEGILHELEKIHVLSEAVEAASPFVNLC